MVYREWRKGLLGGEGVYLTLQMQRTENSKPIFPEMKLCGLDPNFNIPLSQQTQYSKIGGPTVGIYKSLTDT